MNTRNKIAFIRNLPMGSTFSGIALTDSMAPLILPQDIVRIRKIPLSKVQKTDVLAFFDRKRSGITVHRLMEIDPPRIRTKGDNTYAPETYFLPKDFIGKAISCNAHHQPISLENSVSRFFRLGLSSYLYTLGINNRALLSRLLRIEYVLKVLVKKLLWKTS